MPKVVGLRQKLDGFGRLTLPTMIRRELGLEGRSGVVELFIVEQEDGSRGLLILAVKEEEETNGAIAGIGIQ